MLLLLLHVLGEPREDAIVLRAAVERGQVDGLALQDTIEVIQQLPVGRASPYN